LWQYGPFFSAPMPRTIVSPLKVAAQQRLPARVKRSRFIQALIAMRKPRNRGAKMTNGLLPKFYRR
jgi:hypothetical protein